MQPDDQSYQQPKTVENTEKLWLWDKHIGVSITSNLEGASFEKSYAKA